VARHGPSSTWGSRPAAPLSRWHPLPGLPRQQLVPRCLPIAHNRPPAREQLAVFLHLENRSRLNRSERPHIMRSTS
jgi:hypothetical protein